MMDSARFMGRDNDHLVDDLIYHQYIVSRPVEIAFRLVDHFWFYPDGVTNEDEAHQWNDGWEKEYGFPYMLTPRSHARILEYLKLKQGNSFLSIGSGTGFLNAVAGFILGSYGKNHGIDINEKAVENARKFADKILHRPETQCFDWAVPEFTCGNGLFLSPENYRKYDRICCSAVPESCRHSLMKLLKVGGIIVMPYHGWLEQILCTGKQYRILSRIPTSLNHTLKLPTEEELSTAQCSNTPPIAPILTLRHQCVSLIRKCIRDAVYTTHKIRIRNFIEIDQNWNNHVHCCKQPSTNPQLEQMRLGKRQQQQSDIEKFSLEFKFRVAELPVPPLMQDYINYLHF